MGGVRREWVAKFEVAVTHYRVAIQVVSNLLLTPKQMLHFSISALY